ncbi:hypothetical protein C8Q72DRAFT_839787 [Fomitopsis betulina]|nr:hypothetical protein C8Q72DRAFT_839787 [Fomitopsis betulina]
MYFSNPCPTDIWVMAFLMPAFTAATVQVFLVWRITVIAQRRLFAAIVLPVVVTAFCSGIVSAVGLQVFQISEDWVTSENADITWDIATSVWLWSSFVSDILIIAFMMYLLHYCKTLKTNRTNPMLNRIMKLIIETGCLTAITVVIVAACWYSLPSSYAAFAPLLVLSKMYANTMLVTLNNRIFMRREESNTSGRHTLLDQYNKPSPPVIPMVIMTTTVETAHDDLPETNKQFV